MENVVRTRETVAEKPDTSAVGGVRRGATGKDRLMRLTAALSMAGMGFLLVASPAPGPSYAAVPTSGQAATWSDVSVGYGYACGVEGDGTLWCWGANGHGQLGNGGTAPADVPTRVGVDSDWTEVSAGYQSTCALASDGSAWCWGVNEHGELGDGTRRQRLAPIEVEGSGPWTSITTYSYTSCAERADSTAWCWGSDEWGQLGRGGGRDTTVPVQVEGTGWTGSISEGPDVTCAPKADGSGWCWGLEAKGQLGDGVKGGFADVPQRVAGGGDWASVQAGKYGTTCGIRRDGSAWCWGWGKFGQTGSATAKNKNLRPIPVTAKGSWAEVSPGHLVTCGVQVDGDGYCWGDDYLGMLGAGDRSQPARTPIPIATVPGFQQISVGSDSVCGIATDQTAWCWGSDGTGELGNGQTGGVYDKPVQVLAG